MDNLKKYVFNSGYIIGNDEKRLFIAYRYHPRMASHEKSGVDSNFFGFLHPNIAKILTFFDGKSDLPVIIDQIAETLNISKDHSEKMVSYIIENKKRIGVTYHEKKFILPPNVIVPFVNDKTSHIYSRKDLDCATLDFSQNRLFKFPTNITLMVNTICAVDCIYCYADCRNKINCLIPQTRLEKLITDCRANGAITFELMGGEVLKYKNWQWLVKTMLKNEYTPYISTKIPISKKTIDEMYDLGIRLFQISLDSFEPDIIEKNLNITDGVNYLKKMHQALKYAESKDLKVNIHSVITKYNKDISHLNKFLDELSKYSNINNYQVTAAAESLYKPDILNHRICLEDVNNLERNISECKNQFSYGINFSGNAIKDAYINNSDTKTSKFNNRALCTGNVRSVYILPNGDVTICEELMFYPKFILGNVIQDDLQTIWKRNQLSYLEDINSYKDSPCGKCNSFDICKKSKEKSKGVCWKEIVHAYGFEKWNYPDPKCPYAPKEMNKFYVE